MRNRLAIWLLACLLLVAGCRAVEAGPTEPAPATELPAATVTSAPAQAAVEVTQTSPPPTETGTAMPVPTPFTPPDLRYLQAELDAALEAFTGLSSYRVIDLQTGQQIARNPDLAIAGTSLLKIPIVLETYRVLNRPPDVAQMRLITETTTLSGNFTANLLLELIAGRQDPYAGAAIMTSDLRQVGLYNTFIAVPYDLDPLPAYPTTYFTPANQQETVTTNPDPYRQTTTGDLSTLLQMIYECTLGHGALLDVFADTLTPAECEQTLAQLEQNRIDAFVELGTPAEVRLAHKHGWIDDTHGDAAIVFSPGGDYVLVVALYQAGWLEWEVSNPLIGEMARLSYAHFNDPAAYLAERLATPLPPVPSPTATPDLMQARVAGTHGAGLTLREAPGGAEILVLPEGSLLYLLPDQPVSVNGVTWQQVMTAQGKTGWVGADYLALEQ